MTREAIFVKGLWVEKEELKQPAVDEVGLTSAPLESFAFHFNNAYGDDFMLCKNEGKDAKHCALEGRKVTRCAIDLISKLKENCSKQWEDHWKCLDKNNHHLWQCRKEEAPFNQCGLEKSIPGAPEDQTPIHLREKRYFK